MYIAIPHEVYEAYTNNEITPSMFEVLLWLHRRADWSSGKVRQVSAIRIFYEVGEHYEIRTIREALQNLRKCRWITSHRQQGHNSPYWITINNFTALIGVLKDQVLNPKEIIAYKNGCPPDRSDTRYDDVSEDVSDDRHEDVSESAPILETQTLSEVQTFQILSETVDTKPGLNRVSSFSSRKIEAKARAKATPRVFADGESYPEDWDSLPASAKKIMIAQHNNKAPLCSTCQGVLKEMSPGRLACSNMDCADFAEPREWHNDKTCPVCGERYKPDVNHLTECRGEKVVAAGRGFNIDDEE